MCLKGKNTTLVFFFPELKKGHMGLIDGGEGKVSIKHPSFVKQFYQRGVRCGPWFTFWQ